LLAIAVDVIDVISSLTFDDISSYHLTTLELKRLTEFLDEMDVRATLFVVPNKLKDKEFVDELKRAAVKGHELALHGVNHTKNEFGSLYSIQFPLPVQNLKRQKQYLEKGIINMSRLTGIKPVGFRSPYLQHSVTTIKALSSLKFLYDSSVRLFKPAFPFRIVYPKRFIPVVKFGVVEIFVSHDYAFNLTDENFNFSLKKALHDFELVRSNEGIFVVMFHPQRLRETGYRFIKIVMRRISENSNFYRLCDIANMCLRRI